MSSRLVANPNDAPGPTAKALFLKSSSLPKSDTTAEDGYDLDRAFECGQWGETRPSDLFLKASNRVCLAVTAILTTLRSTMMFWLHWIRAIRLLVCAHRH